MPFPRLPQPSGRKVVLFDALAGAWVLAWVLLGFLVAAGVQQLTGLSGSFTAVGRAVETTGGAVGGLRSLPLVGGGAAAAGQGLEDAGRGVVRSAESSRGDIARIGVLLGLVVALLPSSPVLVGYLPARLARARDASALRGALTAAGGDPALQGLLARRAAAELPYRRLLRVSEEPWADLEAGRYERLASEELRRLGLPASMLVGKKDHAALPPSPGRGSP